MAHSKKIKLIKTIPDEAQTLVLFRLDWKITKIHTEKKRRESKYHTTIKKKAKQKGIEEQKSQKTGRKQLNGKTKPFLKNDYLNWIKFSNGKAEIGRINTNEQKSMIQQYVVKDPLEIQKYK